MLLPLLLNTTASLNANFAGTATIVFGQTGALAANSAHSGTATLIFGQTGALSGGAGFAGTIPIVFNQTGAFRGGAGFQGTATVTFGQSGALLSTSALAGTAPVVFGQSGALRAGSALNGSTTVQFGQTGSFGASSAYAATATIVFGQSGDFVAGTAAGDAVFVGTATVTFGQSGILNASAALTGTTPIVFGQTGDFVADGGAAAPVSGGMFGRSIRPTKVYRPFDREIEDIQAVLEKASEKPKTLDAKPKRKREIIRAVVAETVKAIEGEGLIANLPVKQEIKQAAFELIFPALSLPVQDDSAIRAMIAEMMQRAQDAAYEQELAQYENLMAFLADDEEDALCLLLA